MQRLIERFDTKDPKLYFWELTQLQKTWSVESYIAKFQRLVVMVTDLSMDQMVMLFIEGLLEPLRCWVRSYQLVTLQDTISRVRDMQDAVPKARFLPKLTIPQRERKLANNKGSCQGRESWMMKRWNISRGESYASLVRNLGHQGINVLKEKPTILK